MSACVKRQECDFCYTFKIQLMGWRTVSFVFLAITGVVYWDEKRCSFVFFQYDGIAVLEWRTVQSRLFPYKRFCIGINIRV